MLLEPEKNKDEGAINKITNLITAIFGSTPTSRTTNIITYWTTAVAFSTIENVLYCLMLVSSSSSSCCFACAAFLIFFHHILQNTCRLFFFNLFCFHCSYFLVWLLLLCSRTRYAGSSLASPWLNAAVLVFLSHSQWPQNFVSLYDEESARTLVYWCRWVEWTV